MDLATEIAGWIRAQGKPFIWAADWNMEVDQAREIGLEAGLQATFVVPDCELTCLVGGRVIDYFLISSVLEPYFEVELDHDSPWWPHKGLKAKLAIE
eukprot:5593417-Karenia_brevis.AAC.1